MMFPETKESRPKLVVFGIAALSVFLSFSTASASGSAGSGSGCSGALGGSALSGKSVIDQLAVQLAGQGSRKKSLEGVYGVARGAVVHVNGESEFTNLIDQINSAPSGSKVRMGTFIFDDDFTSSLLVRTMIERSDLEFDILVDYMMAQSKIEFLMYLNFFSHVEVRLYRPPHKLLKALKGSKIVQDSKMFVKGFSLQNKNLLLGSLYPRFRDQLIGALSAGQGVSGGQIGTEALIPEFLKLVQKVSPGRLISLRSAFVDYTRRYHMKTTMVKNSEGETLLTNSGRNRSDEYNLSLGNSELENRNYPFFDFGVTVALSNEKAVDQLEEQFDRSFRSRFSVSILEDPLVEGPLSVEQVSSIEEGTYQKAQQILNKMVKLSENSVAVGLDRSVEFINFKNRGGKSVSKYKHLTNALINSIENYNGEKPIDIVSAYLFISDTKLIKAINKALKKGKVIRFYTNSPQTTDLSIVNMGFYVSYAELMKKLYDGVEEGSSGKIEFYEMALHEGEEKGSLHAKVYFFGDETVAITSANGDTRTIYLDANNGTFLKVTPEESMALKEGLIGSRPWVLLTAEYVNAVLATVPANKVKAIEADLASGGFLTQQL